MRTNNWIPIVIALAMALILPGPAAAQSNSWPGLTVEPAIWYVQDDPSPPDPPPPTADRFGSVLVAYNLADLEPDATDRLGGFSLEGDIRIPGTVLSFVGHVSSNSDVDFAGAGPHVSHDVGPVEVWGRYLFGNLTAGGVATAGLDAKKGGGVDVPVGRRFVIRIGAEHDGQTLYSIVGVGARF